MSNKTLYRELCNKEKSIPLFSQDWWLDIVAGKDNWDVVIYESGGRITGALPYYKSKKLYKTNISQPILTQKNGVWMKSDKNMKSATRISNEIKIMNNLIEQIEELGFYSYNQNFDYRIDNWLPFYWKGYKQTSRYTYIIEDISDLDSVHNNFDSKLKNQIRKAGKSVEVKRGLSIEEFYNINKLSFERQKISIPYSMELLKEIDNVCKEKNCREIFYAVDKDDNIHSAIYVVWDDESAYYLMGGSDGRYLKSESNSLLIWEAIQYVSKIVNRFDFEGSMINNIEKFFRSFGGNQKQYFNIYKKYKYDVAYESAVGFYRVLRKITKR